MASRTIYVTSHDVSEVLAKTGVLTTPPIDGRPFKIRVGYNDENFSSRKKIIKVLQKVGFKQIGNTSSWTYKPAAQEEEKSLLD